MICGGAAGVVAPSAITTLLEEKFSRVASLVVSNIVTPPTGAADDRLTGNGTCDPKSTVAIAGSTVVPRLAAVIVTVTGTLLLKKSLTINWTTYVPNTSATNVGATLVGPVSNAVLPAGRDRNDQA